MLKKQYRFIGDAMCKAGAPALETVSSTALLSHGFFLEENYLPPAEVPSVVAPIPCAGMVVSNAPVDWNWRQAGRDRHAIFHPENICTNPGGPFPQQWWDEPIRILTVFFEQEFLNQSWQGADATRTIELKLSPTGTDPVVSHLFWALHTELRRGLPTGPIVVEAIASTLAAVLCQRFSTTVIGPPKLHKGLSQSTLNAVTEYIRENASKRLSLKELSQLACLSQFHFCRQFKLSVGQSVYEYVSSVRIENAKRLLSSTDLSISEVGYRSGLPNPSHFATAFHKHLGTTPGMFRSQTRVVRIHNLSTLGKRDATH